MISRTECQGKKSARHNSVFFHGQRDAGNAENFFASHEALCRNILKLLSDKLYVKASITVFDEEHSVDEERYISIGLSENGRLLILAHTDNEGRIRIISARKASKKEEKFYENSE